VTVLRLDDVSVALPGAGTVVRDVSFSVAPGEMLALVGESGSGKTTTAMAIPRLLPAVAVTAGRILLDGTDMAALSGAALRRVRGRDIGVVFQDPTAALNRSMRVGAQIAEALRLHKGASRADAWAQAVLLLDEMGIPDPGKRARHYPHAFSGGMRQRVMLACALACGPKLLIADEPSTGLDPVLTAQILQLLARLRRQLGLAVLLVSHDLALVARYADTVHVLRHGATVERGRARAVLAAPARDYTRALRDARASAVPAPAPDAAAEVLRVEQLGVSYGRDAAPSLRDINFSLRRGECLGIVGASGSGKTTLARALLQMVRHEGRVVLAGQALGALRGAALCAARRRLQVVFQDPAGSFNPHKTVGEIIAEAWRLGGVRAADEAGRAAGLLALVGLEAALLGRLPANLSGGQAQRVAIARALAADPALIVLDEPTSSLDVLTQDGLLGLLGDLARTRGLGYIVITHDLSVVRRLAHRVAVLHQGTMVELSDTETIFRAPRHPASAALIGAWGLSG
jgi:ABC-type glutathione transport system ATPase component